MITIKKHSIVFASCLFLTVPAVAQTIIDVSAKLLHFDYEEFDLNGDSFNTETGYIPGISLSLASTHQQLTSSIGFESYDGQVDYDGQTQSGIPHTTDTDESLLRLLYRLDWSPQESSYSIYGKIAWQQWDRDILPANNVSGLFEQYRWWAYEAGLSSTVAVNDKNTWRFEFGILKTDNGTIEIDLLRQGFGRPELNLGDGSGTRAEIIYQYALSDRDRFNIGLQYQRWKFGKSNSAFISDGSITYEIYEPRSISKHTIVSFDYIYLF